ncbi:unnamed protein product [Sphagnum tenellum]
MRGFRKLVDKLIETAEYDRGQPDNQDITDTFSLGGAKGDFETTNKGRADTKTRKMNARYGDNAMRDETKLEEAPFGHPDSSETMPEPARSFAPFGHPDNIDTAPDPKSGIVDRLQRILQKAGISDDEMRQGIDLTPAGMQKVAARLGMAAHEVPMLLGSLSTRLRDDEKHSEEAYESVYESLMNEDDSRFGYEKDGMGNVTVRDGQTGKEVYLQGSQATDLLKTLSQSPEDEQAILGDLVPLMEAAYRKSVSHKKKGKKVIEQAKPEPPEPDYLDEMKQSHGTFNFMWRSKGQHGSATARYAFDGHEMHVKILSARDQQGEVIHLDPSMKAELEKIGHDFIANEDE